jgi:two-component system CheB/CheR fusion protein
MEKMHFEKYVHVVDTGKTTSFEFQHPGTDRWYNVVCVKLMDGLVTTFTDVTENKEAAILLEKGYEELKFTSSQLEKSNFDLMQFASIASHDLKEPLRKIQAFGNLLKERSQGKLDGTEHNYLEKVIAASGRMQKLVDDILTLSKLSNNEITGEKIDLNDLIQHMVDDLEITIKEKHAVIKVEKLSTVTGVQGQIHQLFLNLVVNALKFNTSKTPEVNIAEEPVTSDCFKTFGFINPEAYVGIIVSDNGIGFDPSYAEKIFGIFQRLGGALYSGTGIGLAICKKIVENHQGYIKANSIEGEGSKFIIALPR